MPRFGVGVVVGGLLALTLWTLPIILLLGAFRLLTCGLSEGHGTATDGVMWISAWTTVLALAAAACGVVVVALIRAPVATLVGGTLLVTAVIAAHMIRTQRGCADGAA